MLEKKKIFLRLYSACCVRDGRFVGPRNHVIWIRIFTFIFRRLSLKTNFLLNKIYTYFIYLFVSCRPFFLSILLYFIFVTFNAWIDSILFSNRNYEFQSFRLNRKWFFHLNFGFWRWTDFFTFQKAITKRVSGVLCLCGVEC